MKIKHGMILAAGLGKRMQPLTLNKPKPLLEINNISLLERAINLFNKNFVENVAKMLSRVIIFITIVFSMSTFGFSQEISDAEYSKLKKHPIIGLSPKANIKASAGFIKGAMGLYKNSVIPEKYMWLMGLAASAAMKCEYCIHANKFNAVKAGANNDEICTKYNLDRSCFS